MILGLGLDVVEIDRIKRAMRHAGFVGRILTDREQMIDQTAEFVAGRWAAKEAISKAVGGVSSWHSIEVLRDLSGAPLVEMNLPAGESVLVSITHERGIAAATAIRQSG